VTLHLFRRHRASVTSFHRRNKVLGMHFETQGLNILLARQLLPDFRTDRRRAAEQVVGVIAERVEKQDGHPYEMPLAFLRKFSGRAVIPPK
jgi:hypothetical protein